jgi:hypothetical protein
MLTTRALMVLGLVAGVAPTAYADHARVKLINIDGPGVGLNDPTPVAPVGGNPRTTLGAQRLFALQHAAQHWSNSLESSVDIRVQVSFGVRACTATSAVLASAGALTASVNFKGARLRDTWHHAALANAKARRDLDTTEDDLRATFNVNLGQSNCLAGSPFYLGIDRNHGSSIDVVTVALHEFGHGLGFSQFASLSTGELLEGFPDVYNRNLADVTSGKTWDRMTNDERKASAVNARKVAWVGKAVTEQVPMFLNFGTPLLRVTAPAAVAGVYAVGPASFGPVLSSPGITGAVVRGVDAVDAAGPSISDGCSPLTNAAAVAGSIALLDRGTCTFVVKAKNAQAAGALGVIIADNQPGAPPAGLGGADPTITIPAVRISVTDGATLKGASGLQATLGVDLSVRAGATEDGFALVYASNPILGGSSISHWDPIAFPNLLMEPNINSDLLHDLDLTLPVMEDVGWDVNDNRNFGGRDEGPSRGNKRGGED